MTALSISDLRVVTGLLCVGHYCTDDEDAGLSPADPSKHSPLLRPVTKEEVAAALGREGYLVVPPDEIAIWKLANGGGTDAS